MKIKCLVFSGGAIRGQTTKHFFARFSEEVEVGENVRNRSFLEFTEKIEL